MQPIGEASSGWRSVPKDGVTRSLNGYGIFWLVKLIPLSYGVLTYHSSAAGERCLAGEPLLVSLALCSLHHKDTKARNIDFMRALPLCTDCRLFDLFWVMERSLPPHESTTRGSFVYRVEFEQSEDAKTAVNNVPNETKRPRASEQGSNTVGLANCLFLLPFDYFHQHRSRVIFIHQLMQVRVSSQSPRLCQACV